MKSTWIHRFSRVTFMSVFCTALVSGFSTAATAQTPQLTLAMMAVTSDTTVTVSPISLVYSTQATGTVSTGKAVTLKNTGTTSLTINSIAIVGTNANDFFISATDCGSLLAAIASCTVKVKFKPTAPGTRRAILSFDDNAFGSPQNVSLSGIGTTAKLTPASLNFGMVAFDTTSPAETVTLTNVGTSGLSITGIGITGTNAGDFAQTHNCGSWLAAGASCGINVTFKPTALGTRIAALSVSDSGAGSPQKVPLSGTGVAGSCTKYGGECGVQGLPRCCSGLTCSYCGLRNCCL